MDKGIHASFWLSASVGSISAYYIFHKYFPMQFRVFSVSPLILCISIMPTFQPMAQSVCSAADLPVPLQNGLAAFFPFCGNAVDRSGNNLVANVRRVTFGADRNGNPNAAAVFRKTDSSHIELSASPLLQPASYTLSAWMRTNIIQTGSLGSEHDQTLACYSPQNWSKGPAYKLGLDVVSNLVLYSQQWTSQTSWQYIHTANGTILPNRWYHVVTSFDSASGVQRLYLHGQMVNSRTSILRYEGQVSLILGGTRENLRGYVIGFFDGLLDDIALWKRPLSSSEVQQLFQSGCAIDNFNPFPTNLYSRLDSLPLSAGAGYTRYSWSTGDTSPSISVKCIFR